MFTTAGLACFAISRNVVAVTGPVSGVLFMAGAATVCADDSDDSPSRDAITKVAAAVVTTMSNA
jgi:hypothetical protein